MDCGMSDRAKNSILSNLPYCFAHKDNIRIYHSCCCAVVCIVLSFCGIIGIHQKIRKCTPIICNATCEFCSDWVVVCCIRFFRRFFNGIYQISFFCLLNSKGWFLGLRHIYSYSGVTNVLESRNWVVFKIRFPKKSINETPLHFPWGNRGFEKRQKRGNFLDVNVLPPEKWFLLTQVSPLPTLNLKMSFHRHRFGKWVENLRSKTRSMEWTQNLFHRLHSVSLLVIHFLSFRRKSYSRRTFTKMDAFPLQLNVKKYEWISDIITFGSS